MAKALTAASVIKIKGDKARREIPDGVLPGLYLVVHPTGRKAWALRYRANGAPKKLTLGLYLAGDNVTAAGEELIRIRREASEALERVRRGDDPAAAKQVAKKQAKEEDRTRRDHFRTVVERYLKSMTKRRNFSEKARLIGMRRKGDEWEVIEGRAVSLWGDQRIQEITRRDVREHLETLAEAAPIGANRTFSELRTFFNWAAGKDIVLASPIAGLKPPSEENASRNRVLMRRKAIPDSTDDELRWLWQAASTYDRSDDGEGKGGIGRKHRGPFGPFVQMLILTGQRRNEVAAMKWSEVEDGDWTIPAARAKNGQAHLVPLSNQAVAILEGLPRIKGSGFVFTTSGDAPISGWSRMKARLDKLMAEVAQEERGEEVIIPHWTLHDIRRTVATGMQRLGVKMEVTEKVLNHTSESFGGIKAVYQLHEYDKEKRDALEAWANYIDNLLTGDADNVLPFRAAK
jgi:integrase